MTRDWALENEALSAFLDGALAPAEAAALASRMATDPDLTRRLEALAALKSTLAGLDAELAPPPLPPRSGWVRQPPVLVAAAAALAASLTALVWLPHAISEPPQVATHRRFIAATPAVSTAGRPDLAAAELILEHVERVAGGLYAAYRGPHGCRLGVWTGPPAAVPTSAPAGWRVTIRRRGDEAVWVIAEPAMDADRFAALAEQLGTAPSGSVLAEVAADGAPCRV